MTGTDEPQEQVVELSTIKYGPIEKTFVYEDGEIWMRVSHKHNVPKVDLPLLILTGSVHVCPYTTWFERLFRRSKCATRLQ